MELGVPVSTYIQCAEYCDQRAKEQKMRSEKDLRKSISYFKRLKKQNPSKYQKVLDMMGWDENIIKGDK